MNKSVGIMQPYLFPYLGYFQLINAVDKFIFYDDVNFIKRGWINRNKILLNKKEKLITFPCENVSQNTVINEIKVDAKNRLYWKSIKTIEMAYNRAPYFESIFPMIKNLFVHPPIYIGNLAAESILNVMNYLGLEKEFKYSSKSFSATKGMDKAERLIAICKIEGAKQYINSPGGKILYDKVSFKKENIELNFIKPQFPPYNQFGNQFVPGLSIIDVLMHNSPERVKEMLNQYEIE